MALPPLAPLTQSGSTGPYIPTGYENTSADIQNKRAMAQHLMELGLAGPGAGARSWAQVLGSIAQAWAGKSIQKDALKEEAQMNSKITDTVNQTNAGMAADINAGLPADKFTTKYAGNRYAVESPMFKQQAAIAEQLGKNKGEMAGTGPESMNGPNGPVSGWHDKAGGWHPLTDGTSVPREMTDINGIAVDRKNLSPGAILPQSPTAHVVRGPDGQPMINTPAVQAARISQGIPTPTDGTPWGAPGMPSPNGVGAGPGQGLPTGGLPPQPNPALPPPPPMAGTAMGAPGSPTSLSPDLPPVAPSPGHPNLPPPAPMAGPGLPTPIGANGVDPLAPLPPGQGNAPPGLDPNRIGTDGFASAIRQILQHEGGYNAHDMNGAPVNFGINGAANPGVDIKNLTQAQAIQIYHDKYWVPSGAAQLPANMQEPYFDAYIRNPKMAQQALSASGGDPQKFMNITDQFFNGLTQKPGNEGYQHAYADRSADNRATAMGGGGGLPPAAPTTTGANGAPSWASSAPPVSTMTPQQIKAANLNPDFVYSQDKFGHPVKVGQAASMSSTVLPGNPNLTGAAYAATIPTADRLMAQGIVNGDIPFSTRMTSPSFIKYFKEASLIAGQPIDATTYSRRNATATSFAAGKPNGVALTQFRTVINHAKELADSIKGLGGNDGTGSGFTNWVSNSVKGVNNDQGLAKFKDVVSTYAPEKAKLLSGKAATDTATKESAGNYNPNNGPAVLRTNLGADLKLMVGRIQPLVDSYNEGMGTKYTIGGFLSNVMKQPEAANKWQHLQNFVNGKSDSPSGPTGTTPQFKSQGTQKLWQMLGHGGH